MRIENLPIEEYHKHPAISKSKLDLIDKSIWTYLNPPEIESDSLDFGSCLHDCILLPEVFKKRYIELPEGFDGRKKAGRSVLEECKALEQVPMRNHLYKGILSVRERLLKNTLVRNMIEKSEKEVSYFSKMKAHGHEFDVRCRFDFRSGSDGMDFKTTRSVNPNDLKWTLKKYRYAVQVPWYSDVFKSAMGEKIENFILIFIENSYPHNIVIKVLDRESEDWGRKEYLRNLKTLAEYRDNPEKALELKIETIGLPGSVFFEETI